jgi:hypothetical protein
MRFKLILVFLFFQTLCADAQQHRKEFGQNRVQYKNFDWNYYSSDDYDIHYYHLGEKNAKLALDFLEEEYDELTDMIGYAPFSKTKIFLYNSAVDMKQSNIGVGGATFTIGGQTKFVKLQVEIAYPGSIIEFKKELKYRLTKMLLDDMMFGGSLADMFQSSYLLNLPEWFVEGASLYSAYGWSVEMDDYIRDYLSRKGKKLSRLEGQQAGLIGQSVWNYIGVKYGRSNLSNILNLTRIIRNVEHSIASSLGISFQQFMYEWSEYYRNSNKALDAAYIAPDKKDKLIGKTGNIARLTKVRISPDGKYMAYVNNYKGKYTVNVMNLETGNEKTALRGGYHVINQEITLELPIIEWVSSSELGIVQNWYGTNYLVTYDVLTRSKQRKSLIRFNQIHEISFNDNGKLAVISADVKGQNDLYLISMRRNAVKRLTRDKYDDLYPKFIPGTDAFVFSSNRPYDSLSLKLDDVNDAPEIFNLFAYDLDTTTNMLYRMTNTISNDIYPVPLDREHVFYLSDQKGINNLYKYNFENGVYNQVTNFRTSLQEYDINPVTHDLAYLMLYKSKSRIYVTENFDLDQTTFTPPTMRRQLAQVDFMRKRREENVANASAKLEVDFEDDAEFEMGDGLFDIEEEEYEEAPILEIEEEFIDTDDYQFEEEEMEGEEDKPKSFSFLTTYQKMQKETGTSGPFPYETAFSSNNVITSFQIDPLRGFGILMEYEMNDVLENHKFYGGILAITDFKSGDFFAEYQYLKNTIDLKFRYDRNVLLYDQFPNNEEVKQKYQKITYTLGASLPLSVATRFDINMIMTNTNFYNLNPDVLAGVYPDAEEESHYTYAGIRGQWVYDNTLTNGLNLYEGSRGKISFEQHLSVNADDRSYGKLTVDLRRYQKIHKELVFATRFYYGRSFGRRPIKYMLGGLDNWVASQNEDTDQTKSPLYFSNTKDNTDVMFAEFVNLRGYDYNKFSGTNVLVVNAELRFPLVKYFTRGSIKSDFARNLQFIGFSDIGSAWTGKSPFSPDHTVNTRVVKIEGNPFEAVVRRSKNPWLASYGFGVRTVVFGYYARFDFARPVADYSVGDMRFYLSLGYDF